MSYKQASRGMKRPTGPVTGQNRARAIDDIVNSAQTGRRPRPAPRPDAKDDLRESQVKRR